MVLFMLEHEANDVPRQIPDPQANGTGKPHPPHFSVFNFSTGDLEINAVGVQAAETKVTRTEDRRTCVWPNFRRR